MPKVYFLRFLGLCFAMSATAGGHITLHAAEGVSEKEAAEISRVLTERMRSKSYANYNPEIRGMAAAVRDVGSEGLSQADKEADLACLKRANESLQTAIRDAKTGNTKNELSGLVTQLQKHYRVTDFALSGSMAKRANLDGDGKVRFRRGLELIFSPGEYDQADFLASEPVEGIRVTRKTHSNAERAKKGEKVVKELRISVREEWRASTGSDKLDCAYSQSDVKDFLTQALKRSEAYAKLSRSQAPGAAQPTSARAASKESVRETKISAEDRPLMDKLLSKSSQVEEKDLSADEADTLLREMAAAKRNKTHSAPQATTQSARSRGSVVKAESAPAKVANVPARTSSIKVIVDGKEVVVPVQRKSKGIYVPNADGHMTKVD